MAKKIKGKGRGAPTTAVHVHDRQGSLHGVGIGNLRVLLTKDKDSDSWFARGLEIDYAAEGSSEQDVKQRFWNGLAYTIQENLKMFGNIEKLLKVAPQEVWREFYSKTTVNWVNFISLYRITPEPLPAEIKDKLPFEGIAYIPAEPVGTATYA
jgi:hypothetical protein